MIFGGVMNISERITEQNVNVADTNVVRINDNVIKGFHARFGQPKADGTRLVSYYFFYRVGGRNGRQINYFMGNSKSMDAGLARRIALQIEPHIAAGKDILKMKFESEKKDIRFKDFWRYLGEEFIQNKYKNSDEICRQFQHYILPQIGAIHLSKLSARLIKLRIIDPLLQENKTSLTRTLLNFINKILQYAASLDYIPALPILVIDGLTPCIKSKEMTTLPILTGAQIKGVYYRANSSSDKSVYLFTLKLQILTGQSLAIICRTYRQDIKGNKWLLRDRNGKLNGRSLPIDGPLKVLLKQGVKDFSRPQSLYLIPGKGSRAKDDKSMDPKSLAKHQKKFINEIHGIALSMSQLLKDIKQAMLQVGVSPLVVAYLFHQKVESYLQLSTDDPLIASGLDTWYHG